MADATAGCGLKPASGFKRLAIPQEMQGLGEVHRVLPDFSSAFYQQGMILAKLQNLPEPQMREEEGRGE